MTNTNTRAQRREWLQANRTHEQVIADLLAVENSLGSTPGTTMQERAAWVQSNQTYDQTVEVLLDREDERASRSVDDNKGTGLLMAGVLAFVAMLALIAVFVGLLSHDSERATEASEELSIEEIAELATPAEGTNEEKIFSQLVTRAFLRSQGWEESEINSSLNLREQEEERAESAFATETAYTAEDYLEFLNSDSPRAEAAREYYAEALSGAGYDESEMTRLLTNPDAWGTQQILPAAEWVGNTYFNGSRAVIPAGRRAVAGGDVMHAYVTTRTQVLLDTTGRADCGNPGGVPVPPEPPPEGTTTTSTTAPGSTTTTTLPGTTTTSTTAPSSTTTTTLPGTTTTSTTLAPKDPSKDVNVNPEVPEQVRGPGTTPVGTEPGPADSFPDPDDPDCRDDGYCNGTEPPAGTEPEPDPSEPPDEGTPGTIILDPGDNTGEPPPPGGDEGISDPEPEPNPPPVEEPVEGDPCVANPGLPVCG